MTVPADPIPVPGCSFAHIHIDLVGPMPLTEGFNYLLTVMDCTTCQPKVLPLSSITASACALALFHGWISCFGVPDVITSDRGTQFTSSVWAAVCDLLHVKHISTTVFHPQANGFVERFHCGLKDSLRAQLVGSNWLNELP